MNRVSIYLLGSLAVVTVLVVFLVLRPDIGTRIFFDVDRSPLAIDLKHAYEVPAADKKTVAIVAAARHFLDSLDYSQRQKATYEFADKLQRKNWSNFPEGMVPRGGVKLGVLDELQRRNLDTLLGELLSEDGMKNIAYQLAAEDLLISQDTFGIMKYGSRHFYAAFLGEPSITEPWMFQFGGHHLAINATVIGSDVSFSPMLTGGQPLHLRLDGGDVFIVKKEALAAQVFMESLTDDQRSQAVRAEQPIDLVLGPGKYGATIVSEGIRGSELTPIQRTLLLDVINARLGFLNRDDHAAKIKTVTAEIEDTYFGWWGPQDVVGGAYFRVTTPSLVLEYAVQDSEDSVNHVHAMYRELDNDYGATWIGIE